MFWLFTKEASVLIEPTEFDTSMDESDAVDLTASIKKRRHAEQVDMPTVAMVIIYRSLGQLLPESYDPDRRSLRCNFRVSYNSYK